MTDVKELRRRAREHIKNGAITESYKGDPKEACRLLNEALATEIVCNLRYRFHYYMASGISSEAVKDEFLEHAAEEQHHADLLAERITQLDGKPDFNPDTLTQRSHAEYVEGATLADMIKENLVAERVAIESYNEMIRYFGTNDPTSRRVLEEILAQEEEHAEDMKTLLENISK